MVQSQVTSASQFILQPGEKTAATRHLCAGAYLDRKFRNRVIGKVRNDAAHRTAPSYGFDLVPVVREAWRAWWLETAGQAFIASVLAAVVALDISVVITASCAAGIWYLGRTALRNVLETARLGARNASARWLRRRSRFGDTERHRELSRLVAVTTGGCVALIVIGGIAATARGSLAGGVLSAAVFLLLLVSACAALGAARQMALNRIHSPKFPRPAPRRGRLAVLDRQQRCDYVIYRKPHPDESSDNPETPGRDDELTPFTGSGILVHRWLPPVTVQLLRPGEGSMPDREYPKAPFETHELVQHIKDAMKAIGDAADPARLRGLEVSDRLYIAELDVADDRGFLRRRCTADEINHVIDKPHHTARHYLEISVSSTGEVVTTVFLRSTIRGRTLSLDFDACALTRTPMNYQILEQYAETGAVAVIRTAAKEINRLPQTLGGLWRLCLVPWVLTRAAWAMKDRTITPRRRRPIGTRLSIREAKAEDWDDADLDKITIYDDMKIIEQRLLKAIEDFLDARNVDTSTFRRRVTSIINTGFLNMGRLEMNQSAAGAGARVNIGGGAQTTTGDGKAPDGGTP
jgi:hypothetical protein